MDANARRLPFDEEEEAEPDWDAIEAAELKAGHQRRSPDLPPWTPYAVTTLA